MIKNVWVYLIAGNRVKLIFLSGLAIISVLMSLTSSILIQWFIDTVLVDKIVFQLIVASLMIVGARVLSDLARAYFEYQYAYFIFNKINNIKKELFRTLINTPYSIYRKYKDKSMNIFTNDVQSIMESGIQMVPSMLVSVLIALGASIYLLTINVLFFFVLVLLSILSLCPLYYINKRQEYLIAQAQQFELEQTKYINEYIDKPLFVKTNFNIPFISKGLEKVARNLRDASLKRELNFRIFLIIREVFDALVPTFILGYGGYLYFDGQITIGQIVASLFVIPFITEPINNISTYFLTIKDTIPRVKRINEMLALPNELITNKSTKLPDSDEIIISFQNVTLQFGEKKILDNVSFDLKSGENSLIIGPSGTGKSTVFNLLLGIYCPSEGQIKINGVPYEEFNTSTIRDLFAVSLQDSFFFKGTIEENIKVMNQDATAEQIHRALEISCCNEFIDQLPEGMYTNLEENANNLSGGQRQRLAIARALVSGRKFLLLDESTSALDPVNEHKILHNLYEETCITIVQIAHRFEKLDEVHQTITLKNGTVTTDKKMKFEKVSTRGNAT
ncbi:ABC transporter ATP-binding protein [Bacillus mycoides]|uniref:ABC transporter ATP-binding protein n=1 Tax=Bacillus mycoides TaxID=1405 RepID=UPI003D1A756C